MSATEMHDHVSSSVTASWLEGSQLQSGQDCAATYTNSICTHQINNHWSEWTSNQTHQLEGTNFPPSLQSSMSDLGEDQPNDVLLPSSITSSNFTQSINVIADVDTSSNVPPPDPHSPLSMAGDSNGSPSIGSPVLFSSDSLGSLDSMGPSDCENYPISPCHSPYYSRPGSPWPMFVRPSFKKPHNPFWTTFRVKEFR